VSAWRLYGQRLGVARYIEYLLKYWSTMLDAGDRCTLYVHEPADAELLNLSAAYDARLVRPRLTNALWENLLLPFSARDLDVLFGPSYTLPLAYGGRSVVSIHSVDEVQPGAHTFWHHLTYTQKYRLSAHRADRVIVNAVSTKERVQERYGVPEEKIDVIWLGADDAFVPTEDPALLRDTRVRLLGADRPYVLFAGGLSRRRNVPMLLEAFGLLKREKKIPHALLLFGPNRSKLPLDELTRRFGIEHDVVQTDGRVAHHHELVPVYGAADLFVLPSSSEGFSLTLAEAMSCGVPVVTVNRAALGEVAYGYACTIDDPNVEDLAKAMDSVLGDEQRSRELRARSVERAKSMRWRETARRTLDVLRRVAAN
jgi:glycosyltransferase involved in cell wall biosynthesis